MKGSNMRDKARAIFGKTFFENTKEPAPAKNGAVALQKRANARPIPTYKVGGVVKKQNGGALTPAEKARAEKMIRERGDAAMRDPLVMRFLDEQNRAPMGVPGVGPKAATKRAEGGGIEAQRLEARAASGNYKKGGKIKKKADGGVMDQYDAMPASVQQTGYQQAAPAYNEYGAGPKPMQQMVANPNPIAPAYKKGGKVMKKADGGTAATAAPRAPSALLRSLNPQDYQKAQAARAAAATPAAKAARAEAARVSKGKLADLRASISDNQRKAEASKQRAAAAQTAMDTRMAATRQQAEKNAAARAALAPKLAENARLREANAAAQAQRQQNQAGVDQQVAATRQKMTEFNQRQTALGQPTVPVRRAAGGAGKVRKGQMKGC